MVHTYLQFLRTYINNNEAETTKEFASTLDAIISGYINIPETTHCEVSSNMYTTLLNQLRTSSPRNIPHIRELLNANQEKALEAWKMIIELNDPKIPSDSKVDAPDVRLRALKYIIETSPNITYLAVKDKPEHKKVYDRLWTYLKTSHQKLTINKYIELPSKASNTLISDMIAIVVHKDFSAAPKYSIQHQDANFDKKSFNRDYKLLRSTDALEMYATEIKPIATDVVYPANQINTLLMVGDEVFDFIEIKNAQTENNRLQTLKWSERLAEAKKFCKHRVVTVQPISHGEIVAEISNNPTKSFYVRSRGFGPHLSFAYKFRATKRKTPEEDTNGAKRARDE